jgi:hypothetical protein
MAQCLAGVIALLMSGAAGACAGGGSAGDGHDAGDTADEGAGSGSESVPTPEVALDPLLTVADVPEGYEALLDGEPASSASFALVVETATCVGSAVSVDDEVVARFFLDDGINGLLIESGMARLGDEEADRFFDAMVSEAPCDRTSADWTHAIEPPVLRPDGSTEVVATRQQLNGLGDVIVEHTLFLRSGDVVGWVKARSAGFPAVAEAAATRFATVMASAAGDASAAPVESGGVPTTIEYFPNEDGTTDSIVGSYHELTGEVDSAEDVCREMSMGALLDDVFVSVMDSLSLSPDQGRAFVLDAFATECPHYEQYLPQITGAADEWNRL